MPKKSRLEVQAMVSNRDIGFVQAGQSAEIKIDTFDFTRYGLLQGKVLNVSQDAMVRDKPAAPDKTPPSTPTSGALATTSEPQGQELVYAARVSLDRTQMQVEDKLVNLTPGMAVTVEIKTNQRRLIEFLAAPSLQARESAREVRASTVGQECRCALKQNYPMMSQMAHSR